MLLRDEEIADIGIVRPRSKQPEQGAVAVIKVDGQRHPLFREDAERIIEVLTEALQ